MKILFFSPFFYPKTGGLETVALYMAKGLHELGHDVQLINYTNLNAEKELNVQFCIIRNPSSFTFLKHFLRCDVFIHHNVSLKGIWPLLLFPKKKWMVLHHLTYYNHDKITLLENIKRQLSRFSFNVSCSKYVNNTLPKKGKVIYNAYDDKIFNDLQIPRIPHSIVFVGRLVSDKGCDLLIDALELITSKQAFNNVKLSIIGDGPERINLTKAITEKNLEETVSFKGILTGEALAAEINRHEIMVIPSRWKEPFGIVALEGIACGCVPIYTDEGGLIEACGIIGKSFRRNDLKNLVTNIEDVLVNFSSCREYLLSERTNHLKNFTRKRVVKDFETLLKTYVQNELH